LKESKSFCPRKGTSRPSIACLTASLLLFVSGCAGIERRLFEKPFDPEAAATLKTHLLEQSRKVESLFSVGRLEVKGWQGREIEAAIFSAWTPSPLKIKIEVTHPWGQPILHLVVEGETFRLLSFRERKLFTGPFSTPFLSKFLPGEMDQNLIQDLLRAYPVIDSAHRAHSKEPNQISFYGPEGEEVRVIKFDRDSREPTEVEVPHRNVKLVFRDFESAGDLLFARETALVHVLGGRRLVCRIETMVFNRTIPEQVFSLEAPPGVETVFLSPDPEGEEK
jgi:hypothetical protein